MSAERSDIADWPSPRRTRPRRTCFLSSQMNAIGGFSARLNGFRPPDYPAKMSSRQRQETPGCGTTHTMTDVENVSQTGPPAPKQGGPFLPLIAAAVLCERPDIAGSAF